MKVLVVSHTYIVDLNRQKLRILASLEPGIEVIVVVPRRWKPGGVQNQVIETQFLDEGNFKVVPVSNFSQNHQGLLTFGADLIKLLRDFQPQIIQVEQGSRSLAYAQLITLNRLLNLQAKNVFFTWWNLPYQLKFPISWLESYNLQHTDGLIAGNQDAAEILQKRGYKGAVKVMPQLGVDETLFCPQPQPELRQQLGIKENDFVVGFVGRFVEEKGLLTLAKTLTMLSKYEWKWLLVGRGELQETLIIWAKENNLESRLIFVESVPHEQVSRYINLMNVLVLPSQTTEKFKTLTAVGWKEQFGHVLIEAMACGVPVIGSNSGEIPNVIENAGFIFPEGNAEALKTCLLELIKSPEIARNVAERGYKRAINYYTNKSLAQQQLNFYKSLF
ncbi:hormogonium polysaccharide biosynthesis glycosyltransferase HpsO [Ancylothrix sp. C2]|uniref:hormogonium polysaccharide biosynthesis glycosyltransferase HpsO n=1 Tax=Ancylothrix sp. D3o TaxID=2953691 RepID=UPI0021BB2FFD|nr:hormogonium polysaccharide biosynthesis glycosyltransferase HpsO [Ancylothrix sp. D3o]MCT7951317.1 hormogonium polysaccharide biosynthesis glycosyltransferase HpsO [Ancylothrix sp. D3o]